jgi:hypothetical protein
VGKRPRALDSIGHILLYNASIDEIKYIENEVFGHIY